MKAEEIIPATHRLEQSGMTRNEAEAVVSELQKVVLPLATKDDLSKLGQSIRSDMKSMEKSIRSGMESMEKSIRSDMGSMEKSIRSDMESMGKSIRFDMGSMEKSIRFDMESMDQSIRTGMDSMATKVDVAKMETRLFRRLSAMMLAVGAFVLSILRFFPPA